ncbi:MAG TPA: hypothetical protein VF133_12430 [Terriglobales bacterium]
MLANSSPTSLVVGTTFYTAALERPLAQALVTAGKDVAVKCVPYNQLHTFLLDPHSLISSGESTKIVLLLRVEDLIRTELVTLGGKALSANGEGSRVFRQRMEELLNVLGRMSRVRVAVMICPAGRGSYDVAFLGNALRVAEHKIAAELRRQQRHLVIPWSEFEKAADAQSGFNAPGDRLGHVPFSPAGLEMLAKFIVGQFERMPETVLRPDEEASDRADLDHFLASLQVEMDIAPLSLEDEELAVNLVRHTTHFINVPDRKWTSGDIRRFAEAQVGGEAWGVRVRDRYGDYGLSGALTCHQHEGTLRFGLLFLTCPVLGRQVEYVLFAWIADLAEQRGAQVVEVPFVPGRDNEALQGLLGKLAADSGTSHATAHDGKERLYRLKVEGMGDKVISHAPHPATVRNAIAKLLGNKVHQMSV